MIDIQRGKNNYSEDDEDSPVAEFNKEENEQGIREEKNIFFDYVLGNLENQIASANNVSKPMLDHDSLEAMPFVALTHKLREQKLVLHSPRNPKPIDFDF